MATYSNDGRRSKFVSVYFTGTVLCHPIIMDHELFKQLPPGAWKTGARFRYCAWRDVADAASPALWVSGQQPGGIESSEGAIWTLNSGLPRDAQIQQCVHFSDGVTVNYQWQGQNHSLELWAIHPNGLAGISSSGVPPVLDTIQDPPDVEDGCARLTTATGQVRLIWKERDGGCQFLLITLPGHEAVDELGLAASLDFDLRDDVTARYSQRMPFWNLWAETSADKELLHRAVEDVVFALRAPIKPFSHVWPETGDRTCNVNEIHSHILAWLQLDSSVAVELLRTAIGLKTSDGRIPATVSEGSGQPLSATAWPLLNQTAFIVAGQLDDPSAIKDLLPRLHSTLLRTLHYMDHNHNDIHSWQSPREALLPDIMDDDLATVDCSAMLLAEIEAHHELIQMLEMTASVETDPLRSSATQIRSNLSGFFFTTDGQHYRDRYMHGEAVSRITLSSVTPLLTTHPDPAAENILQQQLLSSKMLKAPTGIRGWQQWGRDEEEAPVDPSLQSLITLICEKKADRWCTPLIRSWIDSYGASTHEDAESPGLLASWFLRLNFLRYRPGQTRHPSKVVQWMDRHRLTVVGLPVAAFLIIVLGITFAFMGKKAPPKATIEVQIGLAGQHYRVEKYDKSIDVLSQLLNARVGTPAVLSLLAKSHFKSGDYSQAESFFRRLLNQNPEPSVRLNLALTIYRQGRIDEAKQLYQDIEKEYAELAPMISERASLCLELMDIDAPPQPLEREQPLTG